MNLWGCTCYKLQSLILETERAGSLFCLDVHSLFGHWGLWSLWGDSSDIVPGGSVTEVKSTERLELILFGCVTAVWCFLSVLHFSLLICDVEMTLIPTPWHPVRVAIIIVVFWPSNSFWTKLRKETWIFTNSFNFWNRAAYMFVWYWILK